MDLRKLRYFIGVSEAGGFRRAAETLFVAQPSLSKHIRELEAELGTKLFERSNVGVHLTPAGRNLLVESKAILERIDNLRSAVSAGQGSLRGSVRIGAPASIAALLSGPLAQRVRSTYPELHLVCSVDGSRLIELLEANELDSAILTQVEPRELGSRWKFEKLVREQCFVIGRSGDVAIGRSYTLLDVVRLPLILTPWRTSRRQQMERIAAEAGIRLNVVAEAEAISAVSFARQGVGFAVLPYSSAKLMKALGPLEIAPIRDAWSLRLLVRPADRSPTPASIVVNGFISDLFAEMDAEGAFCPQVMT